jgi:chromosome segregation ATPase
MIKEAVVEDDEIKIMSDEAHQQWLDLNAERDALKKRAEAMELSSDCFRAAATGFQKERDAARAEVCFQKANIEFLDKEVTRRRKENEEQAGEIGRLRNALAGLVAAGPRRFSAGSPWSKALVVVDAAIRQTRR